MARDTSFLNLLRGLAALWVVLGHCAIWGWGGVPDVFEPKKAVDLFMVISGFLMVYTIDKARERESPTRWATWTTFYARRFFRIAPVFYVALLMIFVLQAALVNGGVSLMTVHPERWRGVVPGPPDFSIRAIVLHLSFLFGLLPKYSAVSGLPAWSLSVEMQFYVIFPVLYLLLRSVSYAATCLLFAFSSMIFSHFYLHAVETGAASPYNEPSLLAFHGTKFAIGMLIYEAGRTKRGVMLLLAAGLLFAMVHAYLPASLVLVGCLALMTYSWCVGTPSGLSNVFKSDAVSFLSNTSYSVYLVHNMLINLVGWPVLNLVRRTGAPLWMGEIALTFAVLLTAYPLAYLLYRTIEQAGIKWGKQVTHSRTPIAAPML